MYKQSSEFYPTELAKKVSGLPQTDRLMQQRRKANPRAYRANDTHLRLLREQSGRSKASKAPEGQDSENHGGTQNATRREGPIR